MTLKNALLNFVCWPFLIGLTGLGNTITGQTPVVTVRFANPQNDCVTQEYCLDVEFKADMPDLEVFGMNVRFFYDDDILELIDFRDFQGGYGPVAPNPPVSSTSIPAGPALFNFVGAAEFINGAMQLVSSGSPILLDTLEWTKLFQICFNVDGPNGNLDTFCPPVVWDLEQNPENGGFLAGDDGVVITITDPDPNNESLPSDENADQFNWEYTGNGAAPYGQPVELVCSNINCALPLTLLAFHGTAQEAGNLLEWQTTAEVNVKGFFVQQSPDGLTWKDLAFTAYVESGAAVNHYSFLDTDPLPGITYYRLHQVDEDGRTWHSKLIGIRNNQVSVRADLKVFPNPVTGGQLSVTTATGFAPGTLVRLLDCRGRIEEEKLMETSGTTFDVSRLPSGVYLVWVGNDNQSTTERVFID
jgi:Secretion system C-terminal sorting domain